MPSDPINDRVTKVLAFKYSPDTQTADLFLDELALQVQLDRIYIKELEEKVDRWQVAWNKLFDMYERLLVQLSE